MIILSLYPLPLISYTHDASAAFITDDGISFAYEEEKASRFQYSISGFPEKAVMLGFRQLGINSCRCRSFDPDKHG